MEERKLVVACLGVETPVRGLNRRRAWWFPARRPWEIFARMFGDKDLSRIAWFLSFSAETSSFACWRFAKVFRLRFNLGKKKL